ncbi:MAG: AAA family ATPase [Byssovorax sp.]
MSLTIAVELREALKGGRPVMRGGFNEYDAENVLQSLSISRQLSCVEMYDRDERVIGWVYLKGGMVLAADTADSHESGIDAFKTLMESDPQSYCVYRMKPLSTYPPPIGRLSTTLQAWKAESVRSPAVPVAPEIAVKPPAPYNPAPSALVRVPTLQIGKVSAPLASMRQAPSPPPRPVALPAAVASTHATGAGAAAPPVVAIASPKGGCGKTTIALNLAVSLARQGLRIVLVDVDPNGDVLSAIAGRDRVRAGVYEAVIAGTDPSELLLRTVVPGLSILPAIGPDFQLQTLEPLPSVDRWSQAFRALSRHADLILVDTPAGVLWATATVLQACTHVIGVLQAEVISRRSFSMFERGLASLEHPPAVLGVVLNMFQRTHSASVSVFVDSAGELPSAWLFDTTIPRATDFLSSSHAGMPLRIMGENSISAVTWLFDVLAGEVRSRLGIEVAAPSEVPGSFLL